MQQAGALYEKENERDIKDKLDFEQPIPGQCGCRQKQLISQAGHDLGHAY